VKFSLHYILRNLVNKEEVESTDVCKMYSLTGHFVVGISSLIPTTKRWLA